MHAPRCPSPEQDERTACAYPKITPRCSGSVTFEIQEVHIGSIPPPQKTIMNRSGIIARTPQVVPTATPGRDTRGSEGRTNGSAAIARTARHAVSAIAWAILAGRPSICLASRNPAVTAPSEPAPITQLVNISRPGKSTPPLSCST